MWVHQQRQHSIQHMRFLRKQKTWLKECCPSKTQHRPNIMTSLQVSFYLPSTPTTPQHLLFNLSGCVWHSANKFSRRQSLTKHPWTLSKSTAGVQHSEGRAATNHCRCSGTAAVNRLWWGRMRRGEALAENQSLLRASWMSESCPGGPRFITSVLHYITSCNAYCNTL